MKVTLEFEYEPFDRDQKDQITNALRGGEYYLSMEDIDLMIRNQIKHGSENWPDSVYNFLDRIRDKIRDCKYDY